MMRLEDAERVAEIHTKTWKNAYKGIIHQEFLNSIDQNKRLENWKKNIVSNEHQLIQLVSYSFDTNFIAGFITGNRSRYESLVPDCDSEVWAIYVDPDIQGLGHGQALFKAFQDEMRNLGKKSMCLCVLKENHKARKFYEKMGGILNSQETTFTAGEQILTEAIYIFDL